MTNRKFKQKAKAAPSNVTQAKTASFDIMANSLKIVADACTKIESQLWFRKAD